MQFSTKIIHIKTKINYKTFNQITQDLFRNEPIVISLPRYTKITS